MLRVEKESTIPEEIVRVVRRAFPKGNPCIRLRDALRPIFQDEDFVDLYPTKGQPGWSAWWLVLVTVMQYVEDLIDAISPRPATRSNHD